MLFKQPILFIINVMFLAILHFRFFRHAKKPTLKMQHAAIHSCIIVLGIFGIWAGLNSNSIAKPPVPQFYTLHSWLGILTVMVFLIQVGTIFSLF